MKRMLSLLLLCVLVLSILSGCAQKENQMVFYQLAVEKWM